MQKSFKELLDAADFDGLAIDKQPTGFTAAILIAGVWSTYEFATSPSEAVAKCLRLHGQTRVVASLAPPPY